eukprot:jgi/Orpsp1_1/1189270/evm.model.d7180000070738.1
MQDTPLQFKVWHIINKLYNSKITSKKNNLTSNFNPYNHYLIGSANISIKPLLSCVLREMRGWYNIIDNELNNNGTLGIFIRPNDNFFNKCKNISNKTNLLINTKFSSLTINNNYESKKSNLFNNYKLDSIRNRDETELNIETDGKYHYEKRNSSSVFESINNINKSFENINYESITPTTTTSNTSFLNLKAQLTEKLTELE